MNCKRHRIGLHRVKGSLVGGHILTAGFSLLELLVVISVIALIMAILVPALQRVRRQAAGVVCISNLRQWGVIYSSYTADHDGRYWRTYEPLTDRPAWWFATLRPYCEDPNDLLVCPIAANLGELPPQSEWAADDFGAPGTMSSAWCFWYYRKLGRGPAYSGSYAHNHFVMDNSPGPRYKTHSRPHSYYWQTSDVKSRFNIPVLTDGTWVESTNANSAAPAPGSERGPAPGEHAFDSCINRHEGYVNGLFMDSSARKIGLKELWTLKWHREFNTEGQWTLAGGAQHRNWPKWIRGYPDH